MDIKPFVITGLALGSVYSLSGVGLVVLHRTTGVVNFAYGAIGAVGALVTWQLLEDGRPSTMAWAAGILVSAALSTAYGILVAPRLAGRESAVQAAATIGLAIFLLGFAQWQWDDNPRSLVLPTDNGSIEVFGVSVVYTKLIAAASVVGMTAAVGWLLSRTRTGLTMRAMASDRELSAVLGDQVNRVGALSWLLSGLLAGFTGILVASLVRLDAGTLTFLVIPALAAAIIGRLASLVTTMVGGLAIGVAESVSVAYPSVSDYRAVVPFLAAVLILVWRQRTSTIAVVAADGR